jgi:hypothetical protein
MVFIYFCSHFFFISAGVQGAGKPNLQGGATPVLPPDPRQGVPVGAQVTRPRLKKSAMK